MVLKVRAVFITYAMFIFGMIVFLPSLSYAQCASPASPVGGISYGSAGEISTMMACDGTDWVPWAGWTITGYPSPQFSSSSGVVSALDHLSDVDTTGKSTSDVLTWDGSSWGAAVGGGGGGLWTAGAGDDIYYNSGTPNVGIGKTDPTVALDIIGDIHYTGVLIDLSDIRLKENIRPLQNPLRRLTSLHGFAFEMKGDPEHQTEYGVSAQDVRKVFPALVYEMDENGTLGVNYNGLIAPMIEAMKEQQEQIEALHAEIQALKAERHNRTGEQ